MNKTILKSKDIKSEAFREYSGKASKSFAHEKLRS